MTETQNQNLAKQGQEEKARQKFSKRKLVVIALPVLLILLGALGYYLFVGYSAVTPKQETSGINTALPNAQLEKEEPLDKMAYYEKAKQDSAHSHASGLNSAAEKLGFTKHEDVQTRQINEKLAAINQVISTPYTAPKSPVSVVSGYSNAAPISKDVNRLESLIKGMKADPATGDPEMEQLSAMMDKLIAVQNPELAKQLYKKDKSAASPDSLFKAIPAVIAVNQKARQGSVVELRLLDTVVVNGVTLPKGHSIFGLASFSNQRISLEIKNIRLGNQIIPVSLTVFDKRDGMIGLNAPEALLTDALNTGSTDAIGSLGVTGFDLTTQIAGAGIDAAKTLLTKKIKRVKQNLKAGYPLLLRDNSLRNSSIIH